MAEIEMPQLGETVTEGTITRWFKQVGDQVAADEVLFEVSTEKVDSEVPSPVSGVLTEIRVPEGETVEVGTVLAVIGDGAAAPAQAAAAQSSGNGAAQASAEVAAPPAATPPAADAQPAPAPAAAPAAEAQPAPAAAPAAAAPPPPQPAASPAPSADHGAAEHEGDTRLLSPVVRRLIREHGLDASQIAGTGLGGRITRKDVLDHIDSLAQGTAPAAPSQETPTTPAEPAPAAEAQPAPAPAAQAPAAPAAPAPAAAPATAPAVAEPARAAAPAVVDDTGYVPFNNIRRRTAEHMVHSLSVAAHAFTIVEVDYEGVERVRRAVKDEWRSAEGFSLTYLPFILRAVVDALEDWPHLNASVEGNGLRLHRDRNVGVAVDLDHEGLIVPVVRRADGKRLRALAREVNDLAAKARQRQLSVDDISGGTFTISNNGSFGTYATAAIINQPQVAVLSTDGVTRRPVVVTGPDGAETIGIHSVGLLAMGWDHRAFDGSYAGGFLRQVKEIIETRDWAQEL
jgi:2-oxoglutarate dehydrogenase E2 component (dihydrolipoamide succinyltransferase)